jgi:hypothetical protein
MRAEAFIRAFTIRKSRVLVRDPDREIRAHGIAEIRLQLCNKISRGGFSDVPRRISFAKQDFGKDEIRFMSADSRYALEATNDSCEVAFSTWKELYLHRMQSAMGPQFYVQIRGWRSHEKKLDIPDELSCEKKGRAWPPSALCRTPVTSIATQRSHAPLARLVTSGVIFI